MEIGDFRSQEIPALLCGLGAHHPGHENGAYDGAVRASYRRKRHHVPGQAQVSDGLDRADHGRTDEQAIVRHQLTGKEYSSCKGGQGSAEVGEDDAAEARISGEEGLVELILVAGCARDVEFEDDRHKAQ